MQWPTWIEPNIFEDIIQWEPIHNSFITLFQNSICLKTTATPVCPQCKDYGYSNDEDEKEDQDEDRPTWDFLLDPEESEEESSQADSSSSTSLESLSIIQPCASSSQTSQFLPSPCTQLYKLLTDEVPIYEWASDDDEEMYNGTSEAPEAEAETITPKMPLTPDSLQNEHHGSTISDMIQATFPSHLHSTQSPDSIAISHNSASNGAVIRTQRIVKYVLKVPRESGSLVPSEHCRSSWNRRGQKGLASAQMLHPHRLPVPHFR